MNAPLGPRIPVVDVQIGSADAGNLHADQDLAGAGSGNRHFAQFNSVRGLGLDDGLHGGWHRLQPRPDQTHKHINRRRPARSKPVVVEL